MLETALTLHDRFATRDGFCIYENRYSSQWVGLGIL